MAEWLRTPVGWQTGVMIGAATFAALGLIWFAVWAAFARRLGDRLDALIYASPVMVLVCAATFIGVRVYAAYG